MLLPFVKLYDSFNPRPREGGDESTSSLVSDVAMFQSTPPRRRRPPDRCALIRQAPVSIHAPAKEATRR